MTRWLMTTVILLCSMVVLGQSFVKRQTVKILHDIASAYIDRAGDVYMLSSGGKITRIDSSGTVTGAVTLEFTPTLFDPRDGSHLFFYRRSNQSYGFLLPDLTLSGAGYTTVDSAFAVSPYLVCPSGENHLIVLDSADWSMKKINRRSNELMYETIIMDGNQGARSLRYMKEYQNFVFVLDDQKGILIYNMMGRLLRSLDEPGLRSIAFLGEEVYYLKKDQLFFFDLFTAEKRTMKLPIEADFAFIADTRLYLIRNSQVSLYTITMK
jgi:hypothetical protein